MDARGPDQRGLAKISGEFFSRLPIISRMTRDEALQIFRDSGALLEGHFVLRSGLHGETEAGCSGLAGTGHRLTENGHGQRDENAGDCGKSGANRLVQTHC